MVVMFGTGMIFGVWGIKGLFFGVSHIAFGDVYEGTW
jgi:hypothetical protein